MTVWNDVEHVARSGNRVLAKRREGSSPCLMLVPGTWGRAQTWARLADRLDRRRMLVCVALAGQDHNWPPPEHPSIPQFSEDLLSLADALGLERFFVGGHSLGGMISIDMLRLCPERLLGIVSIEGWTHWTVLEDAFRGDTASTLDDAQRDYLGQVRASLLDRWEPERRAEYGTMWTRWDGWETLEATGIPVLEVWGDRGRARPSRGQLRIPDRENIRLEWIAGASHKLPVEAPDRLAELINGFMDAVMGDTEPDKPGERTASRNGVGLHVCGQEGDGTRAGTVPARPVQRMA